MLMHEEPCWFDIEVISDVVADLRQRLATTTAIARNGIMPVDDALQMGRQCLPASDRAFFFRRLRPGLGLGLDEHVKCTTL